MRPEHEIHNSIPVAVTAQLTNALVFEIEEWKREVIEHLDKKFAEAAIHLDALLLEAKAFREERAAFIRQIGNRKAGSESMSDSVGTMHTRSRPLKLGFGFEVKVGGRAG